MNCDVAEKSYLIKPLFAHTAEPPLHRQELHPLPAMERFQPMSMRIHTNLSHLQPMSRDISRGHLVAPHHPLHITHRQKELGISRDIMRLHTSHTHPRLSM